MPTTNTLCPFAPSQLNEVASQSDSLIPFDEQPSAGGDQTSLRAIPNGFSPLTPFLALDAKATLQHISPTARRALEYASDQSIDASLFSHIHSANLHRVMQDIAHMVRYHQQTASWLLRLKTGNGRYRWYRAKAHNCLRAPAEWIFVVLNAL